MKKEYLILLVLFVFAFVLRVSFLRDQALTFGYDQARDAIISQQIAAGDLKVLGPPSSTPGLYHGVFYYYVLAPVYALGNGSPIFAAYSIAFINTLTIFIVFYLTYLLTKKWRAAIVASFLFAISFESTQYATWLSNPTIGVLTVSLIYLGLWLWTAERKTTGAAITALGLGLSIQAEIFLVYHLVPILIWLFASRKNITRKSLAMFLAVLGLTVSTLIISEIKFGFRGISGVASLATTQDAIVATKGLGDIFVLYLNQLGSVLANNSYPGNVGYGGALVLLTIIVLLISWDKKLPSWQPFLASWLFSHATVVSVGGTSTPFLLVGIGTCVSIILGILIYRLWINDRKYFGIILLLILLTGNLTMILKENQKGSTIFAIQKDMLLTKQLAAVDYTYSQAEGKAFSINSLTSPLWINIVWTYLYKWYGLPKYGYLPTWTGRDQVGQLDSLENGQQKMHFLIIEPLAGIPARYLEETLAQENAISKVLDETSFGELRVQKRAVQ